MEQLIELLKQIAELANIGIDALQEAGGGEGKPEGKPEGPPEGAPATAPEGEEATEEPK